LLAHVGFWGRTGKHWFVLSLTGFGVSFMLKAYWAYDFVCDRPIEAILDAFNAAGPWQWRLRESGVYGDYLNCRPMEHVRVRVHEYPQTGAYGTFVGLRDKGFSALLEVEAESTRSRSEIDGVFRHLLQTINATDLTEIAPYD
jgi:hypothetical protein